MSFPVCAHISDIHFGAGDSDELMEELGYYFLKKLRKMPKLDVIFIQGDTYHYELSLNSKASYNSFRFNSELEDIAYEKDAMLIYLQGTKSHDYSQLNNLRFKNRAKVKIVNTVRVEDLFEDFKVLFLPEEYMNDPEEYYQEYFDVPDNYYDMIVGHGMFEETSFHNYNSETTLKVAPIFNSKKLARICRGPITFGHVHNASIIRNKIFYTGSFSRWCQGEEDPKGYYFSVYNTETGNFRILPVENKMARKYISRNITKLVQRENVERVIQAIENLVCVKNIFKLSLIINQINNNDIITKINILQRYFTNNKRVDIVLKKLNLDNDTSKEEELLDYYEYLFDPSLDDEDKITIYINEEFKYNITKERVDMVLNGDIIKLMHEELEQLGNEGGI